MLALDAKPAPLVVPTHWPTRGTWLGDPTWLDEALFEALFDPAIVKRFAREIASRLEADDRNAREVWEDLEALHLLTVGIAHHLEYLRKPEPLCWKALATSASAMQRWLAASRRALGWARLDVNGLAGVVAGDQVEGLANTISARTGVARDEIVRWLTGARGPVRMKAARGGRLQLVARAFDQLDLGCVAKPARAHRRPLLVWNVDATNLARVPKCKRLAVVVDVPDVANASAWRKLRALRAQLVVVKFRDATARGARMLGELVDAYAARDQLVMLEGTWREDEFAALIRPLMPVSSAILGVASREPASGVERELQRAELITEFPSQLVAELGVAIAAPVLFGVILGHRRAGAFSGVRELSLKPRPPGRNGAMPALPDRIHCRAVTAIAPYSLDALRASFCDELGRPRPSHEAIAPAIRKPRGYVAVPDTGSLSVVSPPVVELLRACTGQTLEQLAETTELPLDDLRHALTTLLERGAVG